MMSLLWYRENSKILMPGESTVSVLKLNRSGLQCRNAFKRDKWNGKQYIHIITTVT